MSIIAERLRRPKGLSAAFLLGAATLAGGAATGAPDDSSAGYQRVVKEAGPALVSVKYVLKVEASGQMADAITSRGDSERETELTAVMIEPGGLMLCSNSELVGQYGMYQRYQPDMGLSVTPSDVKVLIGDDTEGVSAKVLARDADLDLAWLQIESPGDRKFDFVDLAKAAQAKVGDRLLTVSRLGKFFDRAMVVSEGRIAGQTSKPRDLLIHGGVESHLGMPVFTGDGDLIGVMALQFPAPEDMEAVKNQGKQFEGADQMVLPAADVLKATERAKELAASGQAPDDGKGSTGGAAHPDEKAPAGGMPAPK